MILGCRELNRDTRACVHTIKRFQGGLNTGPVQRQAMDFSDHKICGHEKNSPLECLAEQAVGLEMVLIAPTSQRDPGAAVDEKLSGRAGDGLGTAVRAARQ